MASRFALEQRTAGTLHATPLTHPQSLPSPGDDASPLREMRAAATQAHHGERIDASQTQSAESETTVPPVRFARDR
jgi:hypothetical protein